MTNLYNFDPFTGVTAGIRLVLDGINPRNQQPTPPHIAAGPAFVTTDKSWRHPPLDRNGRLHEASLQLIEPISGAKPFEVLVPRHAQESNLYCFVDSSIPQGVKLKAKPEEVRARFAVETSEQVRTVIWDKMSQTFLLEFKEESAQADVWYENGYIARLARRGDCIVQISLNASEIAKERVWQFEDQISELKDGIEADTKRRHGIIAGTIRLLRTTSDRGAQDKFVDFLVGQIPQLTERLRDEIRLELLSKKHPLAGNFLFGWATNVVQLKQSSPEASRLRAKADARKRARADEERERREALKGPTGGGGGQKKRK